MNVNNMIVKCNIENWLNKTSFKDFHNAISSQLIGQPKLKLILANIYSYMKKIVNDRPIFNNNMILAAPSGTGKTETFRVLKKYFNSYIPDFVIGITDITKITPEGFKGSDTEEMVKEFVDNSSNGIGILFIDEFDKRLIPSYSSEGGNVNKEIQYQLLTVIEGTQIAGVDTRNTMFIGIGSFDYFREKNLAQKKYGFSTSENELHDDTTIYYKDISREDLIKLGASNELIGRFSVVVNYQNLDYEAVDRIIDKKLLEISNDYELKISISKEMRDLLHQNANTCYGNRLIDSIIRETALMAYAETLERNIPARSIRIYNPQKYRLHNIKEVHI